MGPYQLTPLPGIFLAFWEACWSIHRLSKTGLARSHPCVSPNGQILNPVPLWCLGAQMQVQSFCKDCRGIQQPWRCWLVDSSCCNSWSADTSGCEVWRNQNRTWKWSPIGPTRIRLSRICLFSGTRWLTYEEDRVIGEVRLEDCPLVLSSVPFHPPTMLREAYWRLIPNMEHSTWTSSCTETLLREHVVTHKQKSLRFLSYNYAPLLHT